MSPADPASLPFFFVSYAHDNLDDTHVQRFFGDLRGEVRLHSTVPDDQAGFLDSDSLRAGHRWSPELVRALAHCQVFIALCSRRYFSRPSCGKEWAVFDHRLRAHARRTRRSPPSLIPLFWVPMTDHDLPAAATAYQHRDPEFGPAYAQHGVRDLVRIGWHRDAYQDFVTRLARRIVEIARDHRLPAAEQHPEFDHIRPAFPNPSDGRQFGIGPPRTDPPKGSSHPVTRAPLDPSGGLRHPLRPEPRPILNPNASTRYPPVARWNRQNDNDAQEPEAR